MKKRERAKRKDNIIFFPGIEKRLMDEGLESLQNKNFTQAIRLLEEAKELDPDNDDILVGLVLAYFEAGSYLKAKELSKEILHKGIGDYFQAVDLYLTVLLQLHEYQEIASTIEALLDEKEIPPDRVQHFITILQFSKRMAENHDSSLAEQEITNPAEIDYKGNFDKPSGEKALNLTSLKTLNEQMLLVSSLAEKNVRPYLQEIEGYLQDDEGNPFLKTILLTLLKEQEIAQEVTIKKFAIERKVSPTLMPEIKEQTKMIEIKSLLENMLESSDPVLFTNISDMVERIFFISYPFDLEPTNPRAWAAAFHYLVHVYMGSDPEITVLANKYETAADEITTAIRQIERIEQISYPNL
ncbi:tetratricopeptide repeat protein [Neobacillus niacini]|uniref:tetratricopeptide repeat protein n=1 Tax=Neobacillus niacini TaxID=86668 RepID=UPI0021CB6091|nr:tetratricopeptide repeat protein [Neobacillus niacini]MCM3765478.1 tetratricopeptide repeat protein [Neobacillus niacini]